MSLDLTPSFKHLRDLQSLTELNKWFMQRKKIKKNKNKQTNKKHQHSRFLQ